MLRIRLQRAGKRNTPQYKVVLAQSTAANQKKFVEVLGAYNPHTKELHIRSQERLNYWMNDQHVPLSETVHNLFVTKEIITAPKVKAFTLPKKEAPADEAKIEPVAGEAGETGEAPATNETPAEASLEEAVPAEEAIDEATAETSAPVETTEVQSATKNSSAESPEQK